MAATLMVSEGRAQPPVPLPSAEEKPLPEKKSAETAAPRKPGQITVTVKNGIRQIRIVRDDPNGQPEVIESQDKNGKEISVRYTHRVNEQEVVETYEADNLDDLKQKHPAGVPLYEELLKRAELQAKLNQNLQRLSPGVPQPRIGDRRIRGLVQGQVVEITDRHGQQIQMRIRNRTAPPDQIREYSAENIGELRQTAPEAAALYERLAGVR